MATNSEGRKRIDDLRKSWPSWREWNPRPPATPATRIAVTHQRRREVAQQALEHVMSGASFDDADALLLAFEDLNARLEVQP